MSRRFSHLCEDRDPSPRDRGTAPAHWKKSRNTTDLTSLTGRTFIRKMGMKTVYHQSLQLKSGVDSCGMIKEFTPVSFHTGSAD